MKELEAFEAWWIAQETGLGTAHKFTAWNAWLARAAVEADRAQRVPDWWKPASGMTAHRAAFFMERFKREEKLLGPNEQAAIDFVLAMLSAAPAQPAQQETSEGCDPHWSYYFRVTECKAKTSRDGDCICWHTEGTGPFDMVRHDDADQFLEWRESTSAAPSPAQQECWCETCDLAQGNPLGRTRMSLCPECGDKRCPRAKHHDNVCAQHQEPPQQERQIAEALRRRGLTLVKTANGYDVLELGQTTAQAAGSQQERKPMTKEIEYQERISRLEVALKKSLEDRHPMTETQRRALIDRAGDLTDGLNQDDFADEIVKAVERHHGIKE